MAPRAPTKKETLLGFLARGVAMIHLDARRPGVIVPPQYADDAHLRLNLSYRYSIPDLEISDEQVQATLSFGGRSFHCILPWASVFGITCHGTGDGQVWPEDLPVEVMHATSRPASEPESDFPARRKPALSAVDGLKEERREEPARANEPAARPHLRLVR
jgi:stringent starvation protein B